MTITTKTGVGLAPMVPETYRGNWLLFADWCTAHDLQPLPASSITVARFLDFEPHLAPATLRRRVTAINHVHTTAGHCAPGTVTAIRRMLSVRDHHVTRAQQVIGQLPTVGWPGGLFGRRDALILTLVSIIGIPAPDAAILRCGDITYDPATSRIQVGGGHCIAVPATTDPYGPYGVWRRWAVVRDRMLRYPSPRAWSKALQTAIPVADWHGAPAAIVGGGPLPPFYADAALFPALDRWGQPRSLDPADAISARAVSHTVTDYCLGGSGRPQVDSGRRPLEPDRQVSKVSPADADDLPVPLGAPVVDGAQARRQALTELTSLDPIYSQIDHRAGELLARTEELLDRWKLQ